MTAVSLYLGVLQKIDEALMARVFDGLTVVAVYHEDEVTSIILE